MTSDRITVKVKVAKSAGDKKAAKRVRPQFTEMAALAAPVTLLVKVSDVSDIVNYQFVFNGTGVQMNHATGEGSFVTSHSGSLAWVMWGEASGSMKVEVSNGTKVIAGKGTDIPPDANSGHDDLDIIID